MYNLSFQKNKNKYTLSYTLLTHTQIQFNNIKIRLLILHWFLFPYFS